MRKTGGFSFLEIMFAVGLIGAVLAPFLYFIGVSHRGAKVSINEISATNLATEIMEAVQSLPVDVLAPIDGSTSNAFTGDLVQDGALQPDFFEKVFGEAQKQGYLVSIPPFPKGWNCNLIIEPIQVPSQVDPDESQGKRILADAARQLILITVRVAWQEYGSHHSTQLKTVRGRM